LVNASLVIAEERAHGMRYKLLETVRQYAADRLREKPDAVGQATRAHFLFFASLLDHGDARRPDEAQGSLIDDDLENFRAAIDHAARADDAEAELRLVGGLWRYWWVRGFLREGRTRIESALERRKAVRGSFLARALIGGAGLAFIQADYERARMLATEGLT